MCSFFFPSPFPFSFSFPCFLFLSLSFSFPFPFPFPFLFLFLFLSFSFYFYFLFLSFSLKPEPKSTINVSTARDDINTHEMSLWTIEFKWGIAIGKVPSLSFLHFLKTNVQPIHVLVSASFDGCSM